LRNSTALFWRRRTPISKPRDMYVPDLHIETLKVKARNFR
jgi:hypothetical protein